MKTIRLTMAQALVRFLENQYIRYERIPEALCVRKRRETGRGL